MDTVSQDEVSPPPSCDIVFVPLLLCCYNIMWISLKVGAVNQKWACFALETP